VERVRERPEVARLNSRLIHTRSPQSGSRWFPTATSGNKTRVPFAAERSLLTSLTGRPLQCLRW
jgi:hypothetical protein